MRKRRVALWGFAAFIAVVGLMSALLWLPAQADPLKEFRYLDPYMVVENSSLARYDSSSGVYYRNYSARFKGDSAKIAQAIKERLTPADGWTVTQPDSAMPSLICTRSAPGAPRLYAAFRATGSPDISFLQVHDSSQPLTGSSLWLEQIRDRFGIHREKWHR
jgi:hypothetical protein